MRFLSLFSGGGLFDLGFEVAGWECVGQCEIDLYCGAVLEKHWPGLPRWRDVHEVTGEAVRTRCGRVAAIIGGFPCQPHSEAGNQRGVEDPRHLWPEFARIIREVGPRWVVAENVPGIRATAIDVVLGDLEGLGYTCWPLVVGARHVGAPHKRDRVWIVAYANDGERPAGEQRELQVGDRAGAWDQLGRSGREARIASALALAANGSWRWPSRPGEQQHPWEKPRIDRDVPGRGRLANADCGSGSAPRNRDGAGGADDAAQRSGVAGGGGLAHTDGAQCEAGRLLAQPSPAQFAGLGDGGGAGVGGPVADPTSQPPRGERQPRKVSDPGSAEPGLGGAANGGARGLDADRADPGAARVPLSKAESAQRARTAKANRRAAAAVRRARLELLGNGVVWQVAAAVAEAITSCEANLQEGNNP